MTNETKTNDSEDSPSLALLSTPKDRPLSFIHSTLDDAGLTPVDFRIYCHVLRRTGQHGCWSSIQNMATHLGLHPDTVRPGLTRLCASRHLKAERRSGRTTLYHPNQESFWIPLGKNQGGEKNGGVVGEKTGGDPSEKFPPKGSPEKVLPKEGEKKILSPSKPEWTEFWEYVQKLNSEIPESYAKDRWLRQEAAKPPWGKVGNWRAYADRVPGWWTKDKQNNANKSNHGGYDRNAGTYNEQRSDYSKVLRGHKSNWGGYDRNAGNIGSGSEEKHSLDHLVIRAHKNGIPQNAKAAEIDGSGNEKPDPLDHLVIRGQKKLPASDQNFFDPVTSSKAKADG